MRKPKAANRQFWKNFMPIIIREIDHERSELDSIAFGSIRYVDIEKHLLEERTIGGLAYTEFIDARDAGLAFAVSPAEIRHILGLVRSLTQQSKFGATAVLVSTDFAFGIMRAMEMLLDDVAEVRAFRHERMARSWLASRLIGDI
jgi:hypothetical protein